MDDLSNYSYQEIISGLENFLGDDSANIFKGPYIFHDDEIYLVQYAGKVSYTYQHLYTVAYRKDVSTSSPCCGLGERSSAATCRS